MFEKLTNFLFISFIDELSTDQTGRRIFTLNGSNGADSRNGVPLSGFLDTVSNFVGALKQFWGHE